MGINFKSACHKCKEQITHSRSDEGLTLIPFFVRHQQCIDQNPDNFVTLEDQAQEQDWMQDEHYGGYERCTLLDLGITNPTVEVDRWIALDTVKNQKGPILQVREEK